MKKQYSFEPSCNGSYEVFTYINGAVESSKIVSLHDLSVYIYQLKEKGYEFCYSDGEFSTADITFESGTAFVA